MISKKNVHARTFQGLQKWAQRDSLDKYKLAIYAEKPPASGHTRRYNAEISPEVR